MDKIQVSKETYAVIEESIKLIDNCAAESSCDDCSNNKVGNTNETCLDELRPKLQADLDRFEVEGIKQ